MIPKCDPIKLNVNHLMSDIADSRQAVPSGRLQEMAGPAAEVNKRVQAARGTGMMGWTELPYMAEDEISVIQAHADRIRQRFDTFVLMGIGGSALGPIAVHRALKPLRYNAYRKADRGGPRFYVEDNIDPDRMRALIDVIDLETTCFNIVTKSGETAETMSQYLIISDLLKEKVGKKWKKHIIVTTDPNEGHLIRLAEKFDFARLPIPPSVGGRFSELSAVGLLPAAVCGIDIKALLSGAAMMDERCKNGSIMENPALLEAVLLYILMMEKAVNVHVIMPYADSLKYMSDWVGQLFAESLGKNRTRSGEAVNIGQTPVKALGVTDQHSQLQLYTEGPYDKVVTFLKTGAFRHQMPIPRGCEEFPEIAFLGGKTLNNLLDAEWKGTEYALLASGRVSQTITLPTVNEYTVGQLIYFYEMVTAYMGELLDVNAYNQPGVQQSKLASYAVLGNTDEKYLATAREMVDRPREDERYIV